MPTENRLYRVIFLNQGEWYELYARSVGPSGIPGFVQIEELVFGARSQVVVDPSEERLQREFEGVTRFSVPAPAVARIDEVEREGVSRVVRRDGDARLAWFPGVASQPDRTPTK